MKKLSYLAIIIHVCCALPAVAQLKTFECVPGGEVPIAQARTMLERVQVQYARIESMKGAFRQDSYVAALDEGETSSGEMIFAKPGRMRWSYKQPRPQEVVISNGDLWLYQIDKRQVVIDEIGNVLLSALPISFLMGIGNVTKDFELGSACRVSQGVVFRLKPPSRGGTADQRDGLEGFDLLVDEAKDLPRGAKITSVGGNVTGIIFENLQLNIGALAPQTFVLDHPKGVDIVDRR